MKLFQRKLCGVEHLKQLRFKECQDLPAMASEELYCPVEKSKYWTFFDDKRFKLVAKKQKPRRLSWLISG